MNNRKKQTAVVAMATVLSVTAIASPLPVMAQEDTPALPAIIQENGQQETAPTPPQPENLQATVGTALKDVVLPEHWAWADESIRITAETTEYPALFSVDDVTYDYSAIEGYNAESHSVERMVTVTVQPAKPEPAEPVQKQPRILGGSIPTTYSAGDIEINETNFPDQVFRAFLIKWYGNTLSAGEISSRTTFTLSQSMVGGKISNLKGIEHFTALKELDCKNHNLTSLDVSNITTLEKLNCYNNKITDLKLGNNTSLKELDCSSNLLGALDVSKNTGLIKLNCEKSQLSSLNINGLTHLTELTCWQNQLDSLNTQSNSALKIIYCSNNPLNGIDVSKNLALEKLTCDNNTLSTINVTKNENLEYLSCNGNQLTALDVSKNSDLAYLTCNENQLNSLDVRSNTQLKTLRCYYNMLLSLDLSQNTALTSFSGDNQQRKLTATRDTFDLTSVDGDLDGSKITNMKNAGITENSLKDFTPGTQVRYTYQCNGNLTMRVWVDIYGNNGWKKPLSITGWQCGDMPNTPLATPYFGNATFTYSDSATGTFTSDVPSAVGTWYVKATVPETADYTGLEAVKEFAISPATNSWTNELDITGWTYGDRAKTPTATAKYGDVTFTYSDSATGTFTSDVPSDVGTWYVKATVPKTADHTGLEAVKEFAISPATNSWTNELDIISWTYGDRAKIPTAAAKYGDVTFTYSNLKNGTYTDKIPTNAGTWYVKATIAGTSYYTGLENTLAFTIVSKRVDHNSQIPIPNINRDKDVDNLVIKDGDKVLEKGTDYDVDKKQEGNKVTVTITFKGNYTGVITKTYTVASSGGDKDNNKPDGSQNTDDKKAVQTGDNSKTGLLATMSLLSAGFLAFLTGKKRRENMKDN